MGVLISRAPQVGILIPTQNDVKCNTINRWGFRRSSVSKESVWDAGDLGSIPGSGRSSGEENGNPLQYSCLGKSHGQRSLATYSPWGHKKLYMTEHAGQDVCALEKVCNLRPLRSRGFVFKGLNITTLYSNPGNEHPQLCSNNNDDGDGHDKELIIHSASPPLSISLLPFSLWFPLRRGR